ncbi:M23 family metallopeptidase [Aliiglaciecola sp. CAU 1673]|uniref:M23 family metallopeptidase n=1 Tax=Aliiglaciecola sp. CAU 1673 TaxID=3032595 RepID=UPI0023DB973A|nr:M23 family metallopeptidase [Aliiglaciecola sp. CAU 1673]MDF2177690.1 M23 family metallopeptidase [Aliiglaciecola sp. CAU 1673]
MPKLLGCLLMAFCAWSQALELRGELTQGTLLRGQVLPNSKVWLNDKVVKVSPEGQFVIGFGRDAALEHQLVVQSGNHKTQHPIKLKAREYPIQKVDGVEQKYVSPPDSVLKRIEEDNRQIAKARAKDTELMGFWQDFSWPAKGKISGVYGSQRIFNGVPKRPHYGLDVAGPVGTPVYAPADGVVSLFVADMYYSGGTLILDHGFGVSSTFIHLSKGHVKAGQKVKQGQLIAEIGATGRVTGPHLDWRINWFDERLDPALLVPANP